MNDLWGFIRQKENRELLGWLGGGAVAVIAGLWAAFVYFFPPRHADNKPSSDAVSADCGSVANTGSLFGSRISTGGAGSTTNCPPKAK